MEEYLSRNSFQLTLYDQHQHNYCIFLEQKLLNYKDYRYLQIKIIMITSAETESAEKMLKSSGRLTACREARLMESRSVTYKKKF